MFGASGAVLAAMVLLAGLATTADIAQAETGRIVYEPKSLTLPRSLFEDGATLFTGNLNARVSMRTVKYARVLAQKPLAIPSGAAGWPGEPGKNGAGAPRRVELAGPGTDLSGFNEARLDYLTSDPARPGCLGLAVALTGKGSREMFVSDPLETVDLLTPQWADGKGRDAVDVARSAWASKGLRYQLSRILDRAPDDVWRFSQDGPSTFVQRRFRKDLLDVGAIDVVLLRGQDVQVNLVVSLDPAGKGRTVLDWYALPKRTFDLGDGRTILRLYVGRHLRALAPGTRQAQLKEMALMFFRQNKEDVVRARNVEKILFVPSGLDKSLLANGLPRDLPASARDIFTGRGELDANLQDLRDPAYKDLALDSLAVFQSPQDPDEPFSQTLESARLADVAPRRDVPALLAATAERCRSFDAPCDIEAQDGLVGQDPLWSLDFSPLAAAREDAPVLRPALADALLGSPGRLEYSQSPDGLTVECASEGHDCPLTLETGASFTPEPGKLYSIWLELGRSRLGLDGVKAEAYGGGRTVSVEVKPGFPAQFPSLPSRVEGVRLVFSATGPEMSLTLRRAVLQAYAPAAPRQNLFAARYLFDQTQPLAVENGPSAINLLPSGPAFAAQWLILDVATAPWTIKDETPRLDLSWGSKKASVPLGAPESRVAVYLPGLPGSSGSPFAGQSPTTWPSISLTLQGGATGSSLICKRAVLSGQKLATWPQALEEAPLLELDGRERFLTGLTAPDASQMAQAAHWLSLDRASLPQAGAGTVRFAKNPWLSVESLLVSDASGPGLSSLGRLPGESTRHPSGHGKLLPGLVFLAVAAVLWLLARRGLIALARDKARLWLDRDRATSGEALPLRAWLVALTALPVAGVVLGPDAFRALSMLGTVLAVPLWRALRPRIARRLPGLAKTAPVHYCTGVLAASAFAAAARLCGAAPVSEFLGLCGLWLFCAALAALPAAANHANDHSGSAS